MRAFWKKTMARPGARTAVFLLCCLFLALGVFFTQGARYAWNRDWYTGGSTSFADTADCWDYVSICNGYVLNI